jgi:hypothetical protein
MNNTMLAAVIPATVTLLVAAASAALTYFFTRKKEREADWRKVKLDLYRSYVLALSRVVMPNKTSEDQAKYADAVNSLTLVASPVVLRALYSFIDAIGNNGRDVDGRLGDLLRALRQDIYPASNKGSENLVFRFMAPPPAVSAESTSL